ncbi:MAG: ComF family protein [Nitrospirae bacterium]|nr:ComF family protein [Nitrospirota bacterium]
MLNNFLNALFPETCPICRRPASDHKTAPVCTECWQSIRPYTGAKCRKCGRPLTSDASTICGDCLQDEPAFESARSFGLYEGALRKALNLLKYHNVIRLSKPLSDILLRIETPRVDAVLPVPIYKKRLRQREFNQSALLAKHLAKGTGSTLVLDSLVKMKDTKPQVGLSSNERRENMRNAFGIQNREAIEGKDILLIDDVSTTGATIRECSKVLKKAGAGSIHALTLAHGMMD